MELPGPFNRSSDTGTTTQNLFAVLQFGEDKSMRHLCKQAGLPGRLLHQGKLCGGMHLGGLWLRG
jgi:hypothetical protein